MSIPAEWAEEGGEEFEQEVSEETSSIAIPVRIAYDETQRTPPEFCSMMSWVVPAIGNMPVQLLTRRHHRFKAKFLISFTGPGTIWLNTKQDPLTLPNPQGFPVIAAAAGNLSIPDYDAMQPLYCIASVAGITIGVMDESYGQVQ